VTDVQGVLSPAWQGKAVVQIETKVVVPIVLHFEKRPWLPLPLHFLAELDALLPFHLLEREAGFGFFDGSIPSITDGIFTKVLPVIHDDWTSACICEATNASPRLGIRLLISPGRLKILSG